MSATAIVMAVAIADVLFSSSASEMGFAKNHPDHSAVGKTESTNYIYAEQYK